MKRKGLMILSLVVLFLIPQVVFGQFGKNMVNYDKFNWRVYQSPHFDVWYYPEEEQYLDDVVKWLENAYEYLSERFEHQFSGRTPIIFFKTHSEFEQQHVIQVMISEGVGAFAESQQNRVVIPLDDPPEEMLKLFTHELTHVFQYDFFWGSNPMARARVPLWFIEGMAEHMADNFSTMDEMIVRDLVIHDHWIISIRMMSRFTGYAVDYVLGQVVHDFIYDNFYQEKYPEFLKAVRVGGTTEKAIGKAIGKVYGMTVAEFDEEFRRYLRKKYIPLLVEKKEPIDYGRAISPESFQYPIMSPVVSPSGELIAGLTVQKDDIDLVLISAKDGKIFKNLTPGFFSKGEEYIIAQELTVPFKGGKDISWSPDGKVIAFFGRTGNKRSLFVLDVVTGETLYKIKLDIDQALSPAFSPDSKKIVFAGTVCGTRDIFLLTLENQSIENLTNDEFFDYAPVFSPDGKTIVYISSVQGRTKLFIFNLASPENKIQLTDGDWDDVQPIFTPDGKKILFASDRGGIFNVYALDLETSEISQYTDVLGGVFSPVVTSENKMVYAGFLKLQYRLYEMELEKPIESFLAKVEPREELPKKPGPTLTYVLKDVEKQKKAQRKFFLEDIYAGGAAITSQWGTYVITDLYLRFSDMLGDQRFQMSISTYGSWWKSIGFTYLNLENRLNYMFSVFDQRYYLYPPWSVFGQQKPPDVLRYLSIEYLGGNMGFLYPLDKFHRIEFRTSLINREFNIPTYFYTEAADPDTKRLVSKFFNSGKYISFGAAYVGDTTLYKNFGPFAGRKYRLDVEYALPFSDSFLNFTTISAEYRSYARISSGSLFAFRVFGGMSMGDAPDVFFLGGTDTLRGYDYLSIWGNRTFYVNSELRFPLIDEIRTPVLSLGNIRGRLFVDIGGAWYDEDVDIFLKGEIREKVKSSLGFGIDWNFIFPMHFDFSKRLDLKKFTLSEGWRMDFWIGIQF